MKTLASLLACTLLTPPGMVTAQEVVRHAYTQFFGTQAQPNTPVRSVLQVAGLARPQWVVEIEVVAARP